MIGTYGPSWLILLSACCVVVVVLKLASALTRRGRFAGFLIVAVAVVLLAMAALWLLLARSGRFAGGLPHAPWVRAPIAPRPEPPVPADIDQLERRFAQMNLEHEKSAARRAAEAEREYMEALEAPRATGGESCTDGAPLVVMAEGANDPLLTVEVRDRNGSIKRLIRERARGVRSVAGDWRHSGVLSTLLVGFATAIFLYIGYVFLDASTRGQFTWSLRLVSVLAFGVLLVVMVALRHGL